MSILLRCCSGALASFLLLCIISCSSDKGTQEEPRSPIEFQVSGQRTVQIWTHEQLTIIATARSGATPSLRGEELAANAQFGDEGSGRGVLDFCPSKSQIGEQTMQIIAQTMSESDTLNLRLTVVDSAALRVSLLPVAVGNRWVYQSAHNRLDLDTVLITYTARLADHYQAAGTFSRPLPMLTDTILVLPDSIRSWTRGLQFTIPESLPDTIAVNATGGCYVEEMERQIDWVVDPIVVPAGTFRGCFRYSSLLAHDCDNDGSDTIVEEIYLKPGVGIVKVSQIRSYQCGEGCSSRWELLNWTL